jgi:hypothetical protein
VIDSEVGRSARLADGADVASWASVGGLVEIGELIATGADAGGIAIVVAGGLARVMPTAGGRDVCRFAYGLLLTPGEVIPLSRLINALRAASHLISSSSVGAQSLKVRLGVITWNVCCHCAEKGDEDWPVPPAVEVAG